MTENKIELRSVNELLGMRFFIPSYQRGYRWTEQQVKDLLNDVKEFIDNKTSDFYSLQPLVVKKRWPNDALDDIKAKTSVEEVESYINNCEWEVIDGQQRLTTIYIILYYLGNQEKLYSIEYATRKEFKGFLDIVKDFLKSVMSGNKVSFEECLNVCPNSKSKKDFDNIDYYHVFTTYLTIKEWFDNTKKDETIFREQLLRNVKFIWYESVEKDPIKVFTRLNIGKIKLTNSELIKALMLNRSNFDEESSRHIQLRQQEIASEWDTIEYALQNDEFWLFLHQEKEYRKPTRIDFIFDLICKDDGMKVFMKKDENEVKDTDEKNKVIGNDEYRTFRYFYEYFHRKKNICQNEEKDDAAGALIKDCWKEVKKYYQIFHEWFNDLTLYHYIGYLRCPVKKKESLISIQDLVELWKNGKDGFVDSIKEKIKLRIRDCKDLNQQYEIDNYPSKTSCKPLLLLHNVQTVINQNLELKAKKEYELPVFYKFPFHLYKKEVWDVEHIDSYTSNELDKEKDQKEWLKYSLLDKDISENQDILGQINSFLQGSDPKPSFENLSQVIEKLSDTKWKDAENDKNKIWNFVLLDAGTNRGYGNAIFPAKRRYIIGKDQGKKFIISDNLEISEEKGDIAFVPPVTKNVFLKYYNTSVENLKSWSEPDAEEYRSNILKTLETFGVIDTRKENNHGNE